MRFDLRLPRECKELGLISGTLQLSHNYAFVSLQLIEALKRSDFRYHEKNEKNLLVSDKWNIAAATQYCLSFSLQITEASKRLL